jgi:hypothetical protein
VPIKRLHTMTKEQVHREWSANSWTLVGQVDHLPWQHVLFYQGRGGPQPAVALKPWVPGGAVPSSTQRPESRRPNQKRPSTPSKAEPSDHVPGL